MSVTITQLNDRFTAKQILHRGHSGKQQDHLGATRCYTNTMWAWDSNVRVWLRSNVTNCRVPCGQPVLQCRTVVHKMGKCDGQCTDRICTCGCTHTDRGYERAMHQHCSDRLCSMAVCDSLAPHSSCGCKAGTLLSARSTTSLLRHMSTCFLVNSGSTHRPACSATNKANMPESSPRPSCCLGVCLGRLQVAWWSRLTM